jgi:hypothetical protein
MLLPKCHVHYRVGYYYEIGSTLSYLQVSRRRTDFHDALLPPKEEEGRGESRSFLDETKPDVAAHEVVPEDVFAALCLTERRINLINKNISIEK